MSLRRAARKGRRIIRREAKWRRLDAQVWWALTVELRYQWVNPPILADHLGMRVARVLFSLYRLEKSHLVRSRWDDPDVLNGNRKKLYQAESVKRDTEPLDAVPGVTTFYYAYGGGEKVVTEA